MISGLSHYFVKSGPLVKLTEPEEPPELEELPRSWETSVLAEEDHCNKREGKMEFDWNMTGYWLY